MNRTSVRIVHPGTRIVYMVRHHACCVVRAKRRLVAQRHASHVRHPTARAHSANRATISKMASVWTVLRDYGPFRVRKPVIFAQWEHTKWTISARTARPANTVTRGVKVRASLVRKEASKHKRDRQTVTSVLLANSAIGCSTLRVRTVL